MTKQKHPAPVTVDTVAQTIEQVEDYLEGAGNCCNPSEADDYIKALTFLRKLDPNSPTPAHVPGLDDD